MRRAIKVLLLSAAVALVWAPTQARADGYVSPWAGVNFGSEIDDGRGTFGVTGGYMGAGIIGAEADFGYSPSFFGDETDFGNNSVITFMGNLIVGVPIGGTSGMGFRPYVTGGLGVVRTQFDDDILEIEESNNDWGWNAGGGVMGYFNDHVGIRGDLRYLRTLTDTDSGSGLDFEAGDLHFWRVSAGITLR